MSYLTFLCLNIPVYKMELPCELPHGVVMTVAGGEDYEDIFLQERDRNLGFKDEPRLV